MLYFRIMWSVRETAGFNRHYCGKFSEQVLAAKPFFVAGSVPDSYSVAFPWVGSLA